MFRAVLDGPIEGVVWFVEFSFFYFWGYLKLSGKPRKTVLINAIISYLIGYSDQTGHRFRKHSDTF